MYCSVSWTRYTAIHLSHKLSRAARDRRPWPLSQVPVFGILVVADGKLYGGPEVKDSRIQPAMVYTQLADANKVLGKLPEAYPGTEFSLQPLSLGAVMRQSGAPSRRS